MKMATRSSSNKNITKGMTYGKGKVLGEQIDKFGLPTIDARNNAIPPAATNTTDQTRNVEPMAEEVSVAMNESGQPVVPAMPMNNVLDILRDTENINEPLISGAVPPSITQEQLGDLDFLVLADLAENSDVNAIRQTFNI
jgi:hypothetical protein